MVECNDKGLKTFQLHDRYGQRVKLISMKKKSGEPGDQHC